MWVVGQRVLSQTEPELGVGVILQVTANTSLDVLFEGASVRRRFSARNAPLRRFYLEVGQKVASKGNVEYRIEKVEERDGLFFYSGEGHGFWEYELNTRVQDLGVLDQFLLGQWTSHKAFDLRVHAWDFKARALRSNTRGLVGARATLLPHQFYIAQEISRRERPRALLADEVGLGKTIEASLVFSSLRALGRANRVLILVPESLTHQWLAELYRRFNTLFTVASEESESFSESQLWICPLDLLIKHPEKLEEVFRERWDLLIVDEAHHLKWDPVEPDVSWDLVKEISMISQGLLLLTATPRQQGLETQFGLLHLVDPERFADFEVFAREAGEMREVAQLARRLEEKSDLAKTGRELKARFPRDEDLGQLIEEMGKSGEPQKVLDALVDRHGTGRVLFRNRRERLKGFPRRKLFSQPLVAARDAKKRWLLEFLNSLQNEKALILCSTQKQLNEIINFLDRETGMKKAVFHEDLDLLERDKQAAWFAQPRGAQILLSSEVGGEGRNFQFCHKLVLYDLPVHPDLVEQRIGRLDRIGQGHEIEIWVPWQKNTSEEVLFRWYHEGLGCFEQSWNGLAALEEKFHDELVEAQELFDAPKTEVSEKQKSLLDILERTRAEVTVLKREQQESTDHLLDLNSFRPEVGQALVREIDSLERSDSLRNYMEKCWDYFGIDQEDFNSAESVKVSPGSLMFVQNFPELEDEKVVTFSRKMALAREDFAFLSADHPMVQGSLTLLLDQNQGAASAAVTKAARAALYFEFLFVLQATAPAALEVERFFPPQVLRVMLDHQGKWIDTLPFSENALRPIPEEQIRAVLAQLRKLVPGLFEKAFQKMTTQSEAQKKSGREAAVSALTAEHSRLESLRRVNPSIPLSEITALEKKRDLLTKAIENTELRLDAVRMVWAEVSL